MKEVSDKVEVSTVRESSRLVLSVDVGLRMGGEVGVARAGLVVSVGSVVDGVITVDGWVVALGDSFPLGRKKRAAVVGVGETLAFFF